MSSKKQGKNAEQIQGADVITTAPSDKQVFYYDAASKKWVLSVRQTQQFQLVWALAL
jgi:hypothetical protein